MGYRSVNSLAESGTPCLFFTRDIDTRCGNEPLCSGDGLRPAVASVSLTFFILNFEVNLNVKPPQRMRVYLRIYICSYIFIQARRLPEMRHIRI